MKNALAIYPRLLIASLLSLLVMMGCSTAPTGGGTAASTVQSRATPTNTATTLPTPTQTPVTVSLGTNLIVNGNAEQGTCPGNTITVAPTIPGWSRTGDVTTIQYGASGGDVGPGSAGPTDRGNCYFWGGPNLGNTDNTNETMSQSIDVSTLAQNIDSAALTYQLSAWLGGFVSQDDHAALSIQFLNASKSAVGTASVGPVLAKDRQDASELLQQTATGAVPAGTRSITVTVTFTKTDAGDNDGLADDLSLILQQK